MDRGECGGDEWKEAKERREERLRRRGGGKETEVNINNELENGHKKTKY